MCHDDGVAPRKDKCLVLSFGSHGDVVFDEFINKKLGCIVHSFDHYMEPTIVGQIRNSRPDQKERITISLNDKWFYHSLGIYDRQMNFNKKGWVDTYANILEYLNLNGEIIDMIKMDIQNAEYAVLKQIMDTDSNLLCKYVKQMVVETHETHKGNEFDHASAFMLLQRLELCFRLYRRDQTIAFSSSSNSGLMLKKMDEKFRKFKNEVDFAKWLFTFGELYFVNVNFL